MPSALRWEAGRSIDLSTLEMDVDILLSWVSNFHLKKK